MQFYYWHGLKKHLEGYVASCSACNQSKKPNKTARCPMTMFHAGAPMERVHLDFVGPLPKSDRANEHLLMIVDQFSKWVECIPLPSQTAEVTARAAVNDFFCRFGYPYEIFTDQGRNFESLLFQSVCELLHIHKARTTPYRPSANGQVERFNRTLLASIRCFVGTNQKTWDLHIPQLAGAIRASVNRSTGFTPNRLMLGREVNLPAELMFRPPKTGQPPDLAGYVGDLEEALRSAHEIARANLKTSQLRAKQAYDLRVVARQYKVGDVIYKLDTASLPGKCKKLNPMWRGPGVILARISPYLYKVKMKKALTTVNHDRLKLCRDRELPAWVNRAIVELQNGGLAQAMQPNNPVTPSQDSVQDPVGVDQKRQMSSDDGSTGGSPKRSWAAEEKKEQREVSPRGRHQDRVPSVERDVPSQGDAKGQDGEFEAKVPGKAISGDHRDSSQKAEDTGSGLVRGTRDGSRDSKARSGSRGES
ncbi:unnamed protein product [Mytilus edulis]|uniref:Integrase catalytic domain-containing protein n=1 Tax=Mytilus edulis TaxID=6550 RepID=A0A8S3V8T3_MYTED|nr:unnamed protein product [Mytilus edulis]